MEIELISFVDADSHATFRRIEPPTCKKCGGPMSFMLREVVTSDHVGELYRADGEDGELLFSIDSDRSVEVAWTDRETWWVCSSVDCRQSLQKAGEDFPYEEGYEGSVDYD